MQTPLRPPSKSIWYPPASITVFLPLQRSITCLTFSPPRFLLHLTPTPRTSASALSPPPNPNIPPAIASSVDLFSTTCKKRLNTNRNKNTDLYVKATISTASPFLATIHRIWRDAVRPVPKENCLTYSATKRERTRLPASEGMSWWEYKRSRSSVWKIVTGTVW